MLKHSGQGTIAGRYADDLWGRGSPFGGSPNVRSAEKLRLNLPGSKLRNPNLRDAAWDHRPELARNRFTSECGTARPASRFGATDVVPRSIAPRQGCGKLSQVAPIPASTGIAAPVMPVASRRGDKGDGRGDVARRQHPAQGVALGIGAQDFVAVGQRRQTAIQQRRLGHARADAVHRDAFARKVERRGARQVQQRPL